MKIMDTLAQFKKKKKKSLSEEFSCNQTRFYPEN